MGTGFWILAIISAFIFGVATKIVIENKGYEDNWFIYGFLFGFIALLVAMSKPENKEESSGNTENKSLEEHHNNVTDNIINSLNECKQLLDSGLISQQEFEILKNQLISEKNATKTSESANAVPEIKNYCCPNCNSTINFGEPQCRNCNQSFDWTLFNNLS